MSTRTGAMPPETTLAEYNVRIVVKEPQQGNDEEASALTDKCSCRGVETSQRRG